MSIDPKIWEKRSLAGEIRGIITCDNPPTAQCSQCKIHYCNEHKNLHKHRLD